MTKVWIIYKILGFFHTFSLKVLTIKVCLAKIPSLHKDVKVAQLVRALVS